MNTRRGLRSKTWTRGRATAVAASTAAAVALAGAIQTVVQDHSAPTSTVTTATTQSAPIVERPLNNNCSSGYVTFTFDDGPRENTERVLDALDGFGIDAVFFWNGQRVKGRERTVTRALADGHVIGNHTWDHANLTTGELPNGSTESWGKQWVHSELERTNEALIAAGAPRPTLYRPPYGATNRQVDGVAQELGLRLVMSWGNHADDNIVNTKDNEGATTQEIVDVTILSMRDGSIITMHDGPGVESLDALQAIVDAMNEKGLCATTKLPEDATGRGLELSG
ncbi:polysaccharide deacetylase family protein [Arthrobacter sp.]|uniref:polysaccharide deacetylase family protein n=1 Tax=Arthrobacter sp. TaxID=1667 RepID=UPI002810B196|nr:polysaccharide deacetylase family protein [Arthrobacter sp.]